MADFGIKSAIWVESSHRQATLKWRILTTESDNTPKKQDQVNPDPGLGFLMAGRLIPTGREGNKVFARMLRSGEVDTGETVHLELGDELVIPAGGLVIDSREIDAMSPVGAGGYAPVTNTVWTWYRIGGDDPEYLNFISALAHRLDVAHDSWSDAVQERENAIKEGGIHGRAKMFMALAKAEMTVIALHRAVVMVETLTGKYCPDLEVPTEVEKIKQAVAAVRHSFEHIDERAQGKVGPRQSDPSALTIFDQSDFLASGVLHYQNLSLNFQQEVLATLLSCRETIMQAIDSRANSHGSDVLPS